MKLLEKESRSLETASLGMWVFLAAELMLFGGIFAAYAAYWTIYAESFRSLSEHMLLGLAGVNTAILLTSNLTMALATVYGRQSREKLAAGLHAVTGLLGVVFLALKGYEWWYEFDHDMLPLPGHEFSFEGSHLPGAWIFMSLYLIATALHFVHLLTGVGLVSVATVRIRRGGWRNSTEMIGMHWQLTNAIWLFLFAIFYLVR